MLTKDQGKRNGDVFLPNRRTVITGLGFAGLATTITGCMGTRQMRKEEPTTFVLVHGAWHGGWCWDEVRRLLEMDGQVVHTPTLAGLGDRAGEIHAGIGLNDHIEDISRYIVENGLKDIVLVGHSYGGMVITGIADRMKERIRHIVYLDAALPEDGQSMISYGPPKSKPELQALTTQLKALSPDGIAMATFPPEFLGIPVTHPLYNWVKARLTPHPLKSWLDQISLTNGGSNGLPRTYIHCVAPALPRTSFPFIARQVRDDPSWRYAELQTGHDAMITAPAELVSMLMIAAT